MGALSISAGPGSHPNRAGDHSFVGRPSLAPDNSSHDCAAPRHPPEIIELEEWHQLGKTLETTLPGVSMTVSARPPVAAVVAIVVTLSASVATAQPAAPVLQVQVVGQSVTATWTAVAGATGYRAEAGATPAHWVAGYEVGGLTTFTVTAPQGTYYLRVFARNAQGLSAPSNVVPVTVTSNEGPPAAPTGLSASVAGSTVTFNVTVPHGATGMLLAAGLAPGQTAAVLPMNVAAQNSLPNVPPGTYYTRMHAVGPGGTSGASNEVQVVVSAACSAPSAPTVSAQATGNTVNIGWSAVAGAVGYQLAVATTPGGAAAYTQPFGAGQTGVTFPGVPAGTYYLRVTAANACGAQATSAEVTLVVNSPPGGSRTPNPPAPTPPNYLPLPDRSAVVDELARLYPNELRNSCAEAGGTNTWLFRLVERLRREDTRWGLNWKRARVGDMSQDVVTYNYGPESDEGTLYVHVVDVIGGHCGPNPGGAWINQTVLWSTGAKWTLQPYLSAGYPATP
jgi:hypothetical protein